MSHDETSSPRLIRIKQVQAMTSLSRSYIYSLASEKKFPESVPLVPGGTSRAWLESEIQNWIDERISAREQEK